MMKRVLHLLETLCTSQEVSHSLNEGDVSSSLTDPRVHARVSSFAVQLQCDVSVPLCITRFNFAGQGMK